MDEKVITGLRHIAQQLNELKQNREPSWPAHSTETDQIGAALASFQAQMPRIYTDQNTNAGMKRFNWASYESVRENIKTPLAQNNLSIWHGIDTFGGKTYAICTIMHSSGQWIRSRAPMFLPEKVTQSQQGYNQEYGANMSYLQRYLLNNMIGIKPERDPDE